MNLLYLMILIPFLVFLILFSFSHRWKLETLWIIGLSSILSISIILVFIIIDCYTIYSLLDDFSYKLSLWHWLNIKETTIDIGIYIDPLSLLFASLLTILSFVIFPFAGHYLQTREEIRHFFIYGNLLLSNLFLLIFAENLLLLLLAWQGISYCSYLLIGLKYKNKKTGFIAVKQFILMHLTDLFLLIAAGLIFKNIGAFDLQRIALLAHENLAQNSNQIYVITLFLFLTVISRVGLFPFHVIFTNTAKASIPVMTLLQTGMTLISGSYLMLRMQSLFYMSNDLLSIISIIAVITMLLSSSIALIQKDLKQVIAYFNLLQIATFFLVFTVQNDNLSLHYILAYTLISLSLLLITGLLIQSCHGERNIDLIGGLRHQRKFLFFLFIVLLLIMSSLPWISSFYYLKIILIQNAMSNGLIFMSLIILMSMILTILVLCRIIIHVFYGPVKMDTLPIHWLHYIPLILLIFSCVGSVFWIPFPFYGVNSLVTLSTLNFTLYQLVFVAVIVFAFFISYIFFISNHKDIHAMVKTPLARRWIHITNKEWYIDSFMTAVLMYPIQYIIKLADIHPISALRSTMRTRIKKLNLVSFFILKKGVKYELITLIGSCAIIVLLLTLL